MEKLSAKELRRTLDWLLQLAICPVCHETLTPAVAQCVRGHPVCVDCHNALQNVECPLCRDTFSNVQPSGFIQQVIEALPHPCRHQGCEYFVKTKDNHEKFCPFKSSKCRYCDHAGPGKDILNHLLSAHPRWAHKFLSKEAPVCGMPFNPGEQCSVFTPIVVDGHFFWGEMKNDPGAGKLTAVFHPVPNGKTTSAFVASVKLGQKDSYRADIKLNLDPEADACVENCISIPPSKLQKFTVDNKFEYRITVVMSKFESMCNFVQSKLELLKQ